MAYARLFIFVEGDTDVELLDRVFAPILRRRYDCVQLVKYARMRDSKVSSYISSVESMGADYIFLGDRNRSPCVSAKKSALRSRYCIRDAARVAIAVTCIEGWYLAGLDYAAAREVGLRALRSTNDVTKQRFNAMRPDRFDSTIDFMGEILDRFSLEIAKRKNRSLKYFAEKYAC